MAPIMMTSTSNMARLERLKIDIRSLLISRNSEDITLPYLNKLYKEITDEDIPFGDFNYTSLKQFLSSMPDAFYLSYNNDKKLCAFHIDNEKSKHISYLVAREKKHIDSSTRKSKIKSFLQNNFVDPHILNEVLQELKSSATLKYGRKSIKKTDVISGIANRIGTYSFYTIQDLNSQLNEFTHILNYDDDYVYFKDELHQNNVKKKRMQNSTSSFSSQNVKDENNYQRLKTMNGQETYPVQTNAVGDLVKEKTKIRLQQLIEKHPEGIRCSDLPRVYLLEYGVDLEYSEYGFNSIIEFVAALTDILQFVKPTDARKQLMVLDARISLDNYQTFQTSNTVSQESFTENITDDFQPIPNKLSPEVTKSLIAKDVMNFNETVNQISVTSLFMDFQNGLDIIVSEIHNPSFFWVNLNKNKKLLVNLMNQLQEFYTQQDLDKYRIPQILIRPGLHVACVFAEMWHRGIIKKIRPEGPVIHFYDYGTNSTYNPKELYFLNNTFSAVPAQAIPCKLQDVKPIGTNNWSSESSKKFTHKVFDKHFIAHISSIDKENNSMIVNLIGANKNINEVHVNKWMVAKKMAEWGECTNNIVTFKHYEQCVQKKGLELWANASTKKVTDTKNRICVTNFEVTESSPSNHISFSKKIEVFKKYRASFSSNSSQFSSSTDTSDNDRIIDEKSFDDDIEPCNHFVSKPKVEIHGSEKNLNNDKIFCAIRNNSMEDFSSYSLSDTSSLNSNCSEKDLDDKMFKYCHELPIKQFIDSSDTDANYKKENISKLRSNGINNTLRELRKLMSSTKI